MFGIRFACTVLYAPTIATSGYGPRRRLALLTGFADFTADTDFVVDFRFGAVFFDAAFFDEAFFAAAFFGAAAFRVVARFFAVFPALLFDAVFADFFADFLAAFFVDFFADFLAAFFAVEPLRFFTLAVPRSS